MRRKKRAGSWIAKKEEEVREIKNERKQRDRERVVQREHSFVFL